MAFRAQDEDAELAEINVTPFIDVMLVLLIVFMVAAPLSTVDVPVDLPTASAAPQDRPEDPLWLSLGADLALTLNTQVVDRAALGAALDGASGADRAARVYLRADTRVDYGDLMAVMDALRGAGYLQVALVGLDAAGAQQAAGGP